VDDFEDQLEAAYWNFDARRSGYSEWTNNPQSERDAFKQVIRKLKKEFPISNVTYISPNVEYKAEEAECVHMVLDKLNIPRMKGDIMYSLVGRVQLLVEWIL
jgi:hypothetical protein